MITSPVSALRENVGPINEGKCSFCRSVTFRRRQGHVVINKTGNLHLKQKNLRATCTQIILPKKCSAWCLFFWVACIPTTTAAQPRNPRREREEAHVLTTLCI